MAGTNDLWRRPLDSRNQFFGLCIPLRDAPVVSKRSARAHDMYSPGKNGQLGAHDLKPGK